jgi:hypothetical protein
MLQAQRKLRAALKVKFGKADAKEHEEDSDREYKDEDEDEEKRGGRGRGRGRGRVRGGRAGEAKRQKKETTEPAATPPPEPKREKKETPESAAAPPPPAKVTEGETLETMAKDAEDKVLEDMENARNAKVYRQDDGDEDEGGDEHQKKPARRQTACKATPKKKRKKAVTPNKKRAAETPEKGKGEAGEGEAEDLGPLTPRTKKRKTMHKFKDRPLRTKTHACIAHILHASHVYNT